MQCLAIPHPLSLTMHAHHPHSRTPSTGFTDPESTKGWAYVDFDWSNWKGIGASDGWAKHKVQR